MSAAAKCAACAVPLNVGAHTFEQDGKQWHCACLLRSQRGEIEVLRRLYEELRPHVSERSVLRGLCRLAQIASGHDRLSHDQDVAAALEWLHQTAGYKIWCAAGAPPDDRDDEPDPPLR